MYALRARLGATGAAAFVESLVCAAKWVEWRNPENAVDTLPEPATGAAVAGGEAQPEALAAVSQADCRDGHARGGACDVAFNDAMRRAGKACSLTRWNVAIAAVDVPRDPARSTIFIITRSFQ